VSSDHERNVRDLKAVLEEVSIKNDEIERENNKLRGKLKEESNRYAKL
jgi:regulator of replication initiation timing